MRNVNLIVIHCAATPNGDPYFIGQLGEARFRTPIERFDEMHRVRGFRRSDTWRKRQNPGLQSVGYHYVIYLSGAVATGRHLDEVPAQARGFNAHAIGICLLGTDQFTGFQWGQLADLVRELAKHYGMPLEPPTRSWHGGKVRVRNGVCGHRDLSPDQNRNGEIEPFEWLKECPGFSVADWLAAEMRPDPKNVLNGGTR